ncbi:MAG: 3-dehydroquinate synthase [Oscillospiraceae bacterium]
MELHVSLKEKSYDIILERGALDHVCDYINLDRKVLIITDDGVPTQYVKRLLLQCKYGFVETVKQGECAKSFSTFEFLCSKLLEFNFSRKDLIIAVGGGVMGDLAGFVAASYMRGIEFCNIPTTTLSQIDSSIGGKVAINLNGVKNIIGAFYQPSVVIIDHDTLKTLPKRHFNNGLIEAVKAGLIYDKVLYELFCGENELSIDDIIYRSLLVKKDVVEQDEKEQNLRQILNFGHTIGHGVESLYGLSGLLHGEAVAIGMLPMIEDETIRKSLMKLYDRLSIKGNIDYDKNNLYDVMTRDKKSNGNKITIVKVKEIGKAVLCEIDKEELKNYI